MVGLTVQYVHHIYVSEIFAKTSNIRKDRVKLVFHCAYVETCLQHFFECKKIGLKGVNPYGRA
jgi:hypothetical protein